jgi:hypothetical protein
MVLRRVLSALSVVVVASGSIVLAAPKKGAAPAPAKTPPPAPPAAPDPAATPAGGGSGSAVQPIEDTPPSDMNGTDENPDAPKGVSSENNEVKATVPAPTKPTGYPIEEALRPITLPQNMSEVSISPHVYASPFSFADAVRARFGITKQIQLGFTYLYGSAYDATQVSSAMSGTAFHSGKALGLDVTVMLQDWIGVRVGVPVYLSPVAVSLSVGAPIKFSFGNKFAIGGLDDVLNIKLDRFAPSLYYDTQNAIGAANDTNNTAQSRGHVRVSAYGVYQAAPNLAWIGRAGVDSDLGAPGGSAAGTTMVGGGTATFLRAGRQFSPRRFVDLGLSIGFDDLAHLPDSFAPAGFLALRI